jgi:hypothetical protein
MPIFSLKKRQPSASFSLASQKIAHAGAEMTADQVAKRHVERALRSGVVYERRRRALREESTLHRILPGYERREVVGDCSAHTREQIAGHHRRCRSLAPSDETVGGLDAHDQRLRAFDALTRHHHRLHQRQRDRRRMARGRFESALRGAASLSVAAIEDLLNRASTMLTFRHTRACERSECCIDGEPASDESHGIARRR